MPKIATDDYAVVPQWLTTFSLVFFVGFLFVSLPGIYGHIDDRQYWGTWAGYIKQNGLRKAYGSGTDYLPLYQYFLWIYGKFCADMEEVGRNLARLRLLTLAFDVAGLWVVARWIGKRHWWQALAIFSLLNVAFSYNTIIWGQVDSILAALVFGALYSAWKGHSLCSAMLFALALTCKLQAVVFVPLWALLMLNGAAASRRWGVLAVSIGVFVATILIVSVPFLLSPESRESLYKAVFTSVDRYPFASVLAANMWYWIVETNPRWTEDTTVWFAGLSYKKVGLALFFSMSALALWPLTRRVMLNITSLTKQQPISRVQVWLTGTLITLLFFFCNTQMHERYAHPALLLLTAYAFYTRDYFPYILCCIAYFLNLEKSNEWMLKHYDRLLFDGRLIAGLWAALIAYLFARLYGWKVRKEMSTDNTISAITAA